MFEQHSLFDAPSESASAIAPIENTQLFLNILQDWVEAGAIRALDKALAQFMVEQCPTLDPQVVLAIVLVSERNGHGHICLDLQRALQHPEELLSGLEAKSAHAPLVRQQLKQLLPDSLNQWQQALSQYAAIQNQFALIDSNSEVEQRPLVLAGRTSRPLLYLRRYWAYEQHILQGINHRLEQKLTLPVGDTQRILSQLFPVQIDSNAEPDWQKIACALAARSGFSVITGGPGTGKTTTVVKLLALLQALQLQQGLAPLQIRLAAPTGKAAARLNESISSKLATNNTEFSLAGVYGNSIAQEQILRTSIPSEVTTLHRLLGAKPDSRFFRHHAQNPLPVDIVVVDEASMVDIEMMAQLLDALRPQTRLILLGDKDQLASVDAGAVLGDLCVNANRVAYQPDTIDWLALITGEQVPSHYQDIEGDALSQAITMLRFSHRFKADSGIGALALLVNEGFMSAPHSNQVAPQPLQSLKQLFADEQRIAEQKQTEPCLQLIKISTPEDKALHQLFKGYHPYLELMAAQQPQTMEQDFLDQWAWQVLNAYGQFQVLTALRSGDWGIEGLNDNIRQSLIRQGKLSNQTGQWYAGRPVLVTRNNYSLKLMNGDIGITLAVPMLNEQGEPITALRVAFPAGDGSRAIRWILPSRLQEVETVFAMTVHKSQGSEFKHTALVLPERSNPVLTKELLYTGITRSKQTFTLVYQNDAVLAEAMARRVNRISGI